MDSTTTYNATYSIKGEIKERITQSAFLHKFMLWDSIYHVIYKRIAEYNRREEKNCRSRSDNVLMVNDISQE